ncbi:MAG: diguanylate cyclase [Pseudoflavonifractor sp.]
MKYKQLATRILCALAILAISVVTVLDFSLQLQHALTTETYRTLSEVSEDYNNAFADRIAHQITTMKVLAGSLCQMEGRSQQDVVQVLETAVKDGGFAHMAVSGPDGMSCSNENLAVDISGRDYFRAAMQGQIVVSQPMASIVNGLQTIVIAVPIYDGETVVGGLFGIYPLSTAGAQLLGFTYYSNGYGFVVSPDGSIVLASEHTDRLSAEKNLFTFFEKTVFQEYSLDQMKAAIENGEQGSFAFTYDGQRRFVCFMPSTVNDWYTFSVASDTLMRDQEKVTRQIVFRLVMKLVVAAVLIILWVTLSHRRHNKEILKASHKYQSLLSHINGGMIVAVHAMTADETIAVYASPGFTDMTGYSLEDIQTLYHGRYLDVIFEADRKRAFEIYLEQLKTGVTYRMPYRILKKDGTLLWVMDNGYLVEDEDGLYNHSIITDITAVKAQEEALRMSENRFSVAINASSGTLFEVDLKRQLYTHFENSQRLFGTDAQHLLADTSAFAQLPKEEFIDAVTRYFFHPDDWVLTKASMAELRKNKTTSYEARLRRYDGSYLWAKIDVILVPDEFGVPSRMVGFMSDIDEIKKQSQRLESQVQTDPMTGLYNKIAMTTLVNKALSGTPDGRHALITLDIDNFKGINDTLGHAFGDLVIMEVCAKLKISFRSHDIVGRMGGDEFAIFLENVPDTSSVLKKATELSAALRQTYSGEKGDYKISCSFGIIMIEGNCGSIEQLYRKADAALYQAKQNGKDQFVLYQEENADQYPIETIRTNDEELRNLKASHNIEAQIFELLYTSKDFNVSIHMALAAIGQQYHVSRVSIFENDDDNLTTSNIHEWCNVDIPPAIDALQNMPIRSGTESIFDRFDSSGLLYCSNIRELPPYLQQILGSKGVLSALKVTITNDERTCGFIGFDDCSEHRVWTSEEIESLTFLSKVLSVFLFKKKTEIALLENLHTRLKILDVLPDYVCVVNPETHSLVYANSKMMQVLPTALPGTFCFTTLRGGQDGPCETCLVERIRRGDTDNLEIISQDGRLHLHVDAMTINWTNDKQMVLLYGAKGTLSPPEE